MKGEFIASTIVLCLILLVALANDCGSTVTETPAQAARHYANCAEWQKAVESYDKALEASPTDAVWLARRGYANAKLGNFKQALVDLDTAIKYDGTCADAYSRRARVYDVLGLKPFAQQDAKRALQLISSVPKEADLLLEHAGLLYIIDNKEAADRESEQLIEILTKRKDLEAILQTGHAQAYLRRYQDAINSYDRCIDIKPTCLDLYFSRGAAYWHLENWSEAQYNFDLYILHNQNNPLAFWAKGSCLEKKGEYSKAILASNKAIELAPNFAFGYYLRGLANHHLGHSEGRKNYQKSIDDLTTAVTLNSMESAWFTERATVFDHLEQHAKALKDAQQAVSLDPNNASAYKVLGTSQCVLRQFSEAITAHNKAIELSPKWSGAYYSRGYCYRNMKQYKKAIADFTEAIKYDPKNEFNFCARGCALVADHQYQRAIADCNESLELSPMRTHPRLSRGIANARLGKYTVALQDFDNILSRYPNDGNAFFERSWVYKKLGKMKKYESDLTRAKTLGYQSSD